MDLECGVHSEGYESKRGRLGRILFKCYRDTPYTLARVDSLVHNQLVSLSLVTLLGSTGSLNHVILVPISIISYVHTEY